MALSGSTRWEIRTTGSDTNGGGFVSGASGTDWSQQSSPQYSVTDAVANGTTTVTSATASFGTDVIGNIAYIGSSWYQITARTNSTTITVDRTITAASGLTLNIGGALATLDKIRDIWASGINTNGQAAWVKATGTYTPAGTAINIPASYALIGYGTTRGDSTQVSVDASGMSAGVHAITSGDHAFVANFSVSNAKANAFRASGQFACLNCTAIAAATDGFNGAQCIGCRATQCQVGFNSSILMMVGCIADNNLQQGLLYGRAAYCVAYNNNTSGGSYDNFQTTIEQCYAINCTAIGNNSARDGFNAPNKAVLINCIAYGHTRYGFNFSNTSLAEYGGRYSLAAGSNGTANANNLGSEFGPAIIALTANPFTDAASLDFTLNSTSGGGALLRAAGWPGQIVGTGGTGYPDIGAFQHQDSGGGSTFVGGINWSGGYTG